MQQITIPGSEGREISLSIDFPEQAFKSPVVLFLHGFKGFKDWGQWPILGKAFAKRGFACVRMNFSHNGTTPETPFDFSDLEAFGHNTFTKETFDVQCVLDWLFSASEIQEKIDVNELFIVAHSRGGAIAMITAAEDDRVKKIATLSSVSTLQRFSADELEGWKKQGVVYALNGRTNQNMPLYYDLAEDFLKNKDRFDLEKVAPKVAQPFLVIHAEKDETVPVTEGKNIARWAQNATYKELPAANHSFGGAHPYVSKSLPADTQKAVDLMVSFFS